MKITQLRNATLIVQFGDVHLLVDPMLAPRGQLPSLKFVTRSRPPFGSLRQWSPGHMAAVCE